MSSPQPQDAHKGPASQKHIDSQNEPVTVDPAKPTTRSYKRMNAGGLHSSRSRNQIKKPRLAGSGRGSVADLKRAAHWETVPSP
jgi:hypothetical protein